MGRIFRAGFIGMKVHTNGRCNAEGHVTSEDSPMHLWCAMLSKVCVPSDTRCHCRMAEDEYPDDIKMRVSIETVSLGLSRRPSKEGKFLAVCVGVTERRRQHRFRVC